MKTLVLLIPVTDYAPVEKARKLAINYLGTRTLNSEMSYVTGALALETKLKPEEKEKLAEILDKQDVFIIFIEYTNEEEGITCKQSPNYINAKLSV